MKYASPHRSLTSAPPIGGLRDIIYYMLMRSCVKSLGSLDKPSIAPKYGISG